MGGGGKWREEEMGRRENTSDLVLQAPIAPLPYLACPCQTSEYAQIDDQVGDENGQEHLPVELACSPNAPAGPKGCVVPVIPAREKKKKVFLITSINQWNMFIATWYP